MPPRRSAAAIRSINLFVWHEKDFNQKRIQVAKLYIELASLDKSKRGQYLREALASIDGAEQKSDEGFQFHSSSRYVRDYFEVLFQVGSTHAAAGDYVEAAGIFGRVMAELQNRDIRIAQQVHDYSIPGYTNRAKLELALVYLKQNALAQAKPLLQEVIAWAGNEANAGAAALFYRDEDVTDLRFLEAKSRLTLGRIAMLQKDHRAAMENFGRIFLFPEAGAEDGFMDIGFEALIFAMQDCLNQNQGDLAKAKAEFNAAFPWRQINGYADFKEAMEIEFDLSSSRNDIWDIVLDGVSRYPLQKDAETVLAKVRALSTMR
jgi:tetratricopeptide (TPR) repeat protein